MSPRSRREGAPEEPRVIYEIRPLDFLRLISGGASGPQLFLVGRLKIRGDLFLAARIQSMFAIPSAQGAAPGARGG